MILEELDVVLRGTESTIECGINFEPMERAIKQLELRGNSEPAAAASAVSASQPPARSNTSTLGDSRPPATPTSNGNGSRSRPQATPTGQMTRSALNPAITQSRQSTARVAAMTPPATPGENLSKSAIYVNSLPTDAKEADIVEAFKDCGGIKMVNARHIATGGFAFVFFDSDDGAQKALEQARVEVKGKTVNVLAKKQIPGA